MPTAPTLGNPPLFESEPETGAQPPVLAGMVLQPSKQVLLSLDYWNIKRTDLIAEIGDDVMLANSTKYANLIHRDEDQYIDYIDLYKENRGAQKAAGIDLTIDYKGVKTWAGNFGGRLSGTYVTDSKIQNEKGEPLRQQSGPLCHRRRGAALAPYHHLDWDRPVCGQPVEYLQQRL
jgi:hypothetical protein